MAEYLARDRCPDGAVMFGSAGTATQPGHPASTATVRVMHELGIDVTPHRSRSLWATRETFDVVYALAGEHREAVTSRWPDAEVHMLDPADRSIADPYGRSMAAYRGAREEIAEAVAARLGEWTGSAD